MGVTIKVHKRTSPKDKSKIKTTVSNNVSVRTDEDKIASVSRSKNVSHNKKYK